MFGNYLATALSNLARNWLYAAISIFGLAVSFAGGILVAQFVRNEFSYDRWIPGYEDVYKLTSTIEQPGQPAYPGDIVGGSAAKELKEQFKPTLAVSRLRQDFPTIRQTPDTGDGGVADEHFAWVDPEFFKVFPLPVVAGELTTALDQPDTVVLTEAMARLYFGTKDVMGKTLDVQVGTTKRPMRVTAILKDLPSNTTLVTEIFATGKSTYSPLTAIDGRPPQRTNVSVQSFVRMAPGTTPEQLQAAIDAVAEPYAKAFAGFGGGIKASMSFVPLKDNHLTPPGLTNSVIKPVGSPATAMAIAAVGALIVLVAGINFVTLMTARASRRAIEVGVRKANGANRGDLIVQFMGEALIYAILSMAIAVAIASALAQPFSDFVQRGLKLDFIGDPMLLVGLLAATLIIGILGGIYPALVLSSFRPGTVLKGGQAKGSTGSSGLRNALVVVQFAILIGLIVSTVTIYQQTRYALGHGLGEDADFIIQVNTNCANPAFLQEVRKLPGVERAACSSLNALSSPNSKNITEVPKLDGGKLSIDIAPVHFEFFETYNIKPLAGRTFERDRGAADNPPLPQQAPPVPGQPPAPPQFAPPRPIILNETAVRMLGYASPKDAVDKQLIWQQPGSGPNPQPSNIIGVIPDLPVTVSASASPAVYFVFDNAISRLSIRTRAGEDLQNTISEIQRLWKSTNNTSPIRMVFYSDYLRTQYLDIIIQGTLIGICAGAAIVIACLGLFALSAFAAERRTKEIGIRKALGATTGNVLGLLMWQFTVPVLIAIAIALPAGYFVMQQWLQGYIYHVDLSPWVFAVAAGVALAVAWITVSFQTLVVARAKPVKALRYE